MGILSVGRGRLRFGEIPMVPTLTDFTRLNMAAKPPSPSPPQLYGNYLLLLAHLSHTKCFSYYFILNTLSERWTFRKYLLME